MSKTVVTHLSLDLDAATACWLVKQYFPDYQDAQVSFVPAGLTLDHLSPDANPSITHVDTGLGRFDHHQTDEYTSSAKRVYEYLVNNHLLSQKEIMPLERIVNLVTEIDHYAEAYYPDATADRYDFCLYQIIEGLKNTLRDDNQVMEIVFKLLNAALQIFKNKLKAEEEIKKGLVFQSAWGKSLAMRTGSEEAVKLALKMHYSLVIRKDPKKGHVRIKTLPEKKLDLTPLYQRIKAVDSQGTWFLHVSKNMLLNSSSKNPNFIPTTLSLQRLIEIVKEN